VGNHLEELKSGVRLSLITVGAIVLVSTLVVGLRLIETRVRNRMLLGATIVLVVAMILRLTVARWAKWFFAACCLITLRALVMGALGRTISVPSIAASRSLFAEIAGISAAMAFLSFRFVSARPNSLDSICLVGALTATMYSLITDKPFQWISVALVFLCVCDGYSRFVLRNRAGVTTA